MRIIECHVGLAVGSFDAEGAAVLFPKIVIRIGAFPASGAAAPCV